MSACLGLALKYAGRASTAGATVIRIDNFELALAQIPGPDGAIHNILALTFAWEDMGANGLPDWVGTGNAMEVADGGLVVRLGGLDAFFPLASAGQAHPALLDRTRVLDLMRAHGGLHVCAFGNEGDMLASQAFMIKADGA